MVQLTTPERPLSTRRLSRTYLAGMSLLAAMVVMQAIYTIREADAPGHERMPTQLAFSALLLLAVVLEALLVFRPAVRSMGGLIREQHAATTRHCLELLEQQQELFAQQEALLGQRESLRQRTEELSRLSRVMDATPDPVVVFSADGRVLYANAAARPYVDRIAGRRWPFAYSLLARWAGWQLRDVGIPHALVHGVWQGESALRDATGDEIPVLQTVIAHRDNTGLVHSWSTIAHDISAQKRLQASLADREQRNRAVINSLAEGVVVQSRDGRIIAYNTSAERILGASGEELTSRLPSDPAWELRDEELRVIPLDEHPVARARLRGEASDGAVVGMHRPDGARIWLSLNARPMSQSDEPGEAAAVATFTDITAHRALARELATLSVVAKQSDYAVATTDANDCVTWVNPAWERLSGYSLADVAGRQPGELLRGPHTNPDTLSGLRAAQRAGESHRCELLNYRKDGTPHWIELTITPIKQDNGTTGFVRMSHDISARRREERERQQLAGALAVTADGIAIAGVSGAFEFVNESYARLHGTRPAELIGAPWSELYAAEESARLTREAFPEVTALGFWQGETVGRRRDGSSYPQELSLTLLPLGGIVAIARDISERKATEERLLHLSVRDELTGLYNRRGFLAQAERLLDIAARQRTPCALIYGDLDAFKGINDGYGHDAGDSALVEVAAVLTSVFRSTDLVARLGGDEFTVLAFDASPQDVDGLLARLEGAVQARNAARSTDPARAWSVGISTGVAHFDPARPVNVETLMREADRAQYQVKRLRQARRAQAA